ncbi:MAG: glycoside hydrolase family 16 protein [Bacteroidota bacterium]|nr:glycoside hydrolase family 16 protein [Bacteroidota bacterium]MEE3148745.1 glycoside hydrolase family 16 protein [Bacteroidota bacterium]MEE3225358.1 glycoside hydrolase family 16 protein [Bacteroidota bacterium]MEE3243654.1 glycoside hydrolase family 16 protein [Bacteroidota bacterium]
MKKILVFIAIISFGVHAQERKLMWSDEFNGDALDLTSWNFELGDGCPNLCGWGNNERQVYTKENHRLEDGKLIITAKKEGDRYTSTRITTQGKHEFQYGRMEARAKVAVGQGIWPAFWMLGSDIKEVGWPASGEIDILEYVGREEDMVYTTLHVPAGHGDSAFSKKTKFEDIEKDYHVYAAEWSPEQIEFFVDDQSVFVYNPEDKTKAVWPFDQPFYFIINLAIGGNFGGPEVDDSIFPQEYAIDYVRVYQLEP